MVGVSSQFPPGWGCPCFADHRRTAGGWDGSPILGDESMHPGERRRVGYFFLSGNEVAAALSQKPSFYLWESRVIGEARIVDPDRSGGIA